MSPHALRPIAFALVFSLAGAAAGQDGLTLVADGRSDYVIVCPAKSSPPQVYAAEELRSFMKQMTGAELPITTDAEPLPAKAILLGHTQHTDDALGRKMEMSDLGDDGFMLVTTPKHLLILAGPVRGTLYGVYELLEKYGGCRWYAKFHSVIPERSTWRIPAIRDTQTPAFVMREPFWWGMFEGDFAARCRTNGNRMQLTEKHGGKIRFGAGMFVHTFYRLMSPAEFFADHPEYFSEIKGKRVADHAQLCLTNPNVVRIVTERVLAKIRTDPTAKLFSVSQNDWRGYCTCAKCKAIDDREGSSAGTMIHFVNQVAEAVEREFPDVWIETLAYHYTRTPPKHIKPRHNVVPRLCTIECDFSLPLDKSKYAQNVKFVTDMRGWSAITDKLYVWDYTTNFLHYTGPHPNFNCLQGNVKFFRDNNVVGLFEQGAYHAPHSEFGELRAWVLAKLLWNPDQDIEALYEDFFNGYYGPAAKLVRQYFDELQALSKPDEHVLRCFVSMKAKWLTDEFLARATQLWADAERLTAKDPQYSYNARMGAIPVIYAKLQRWPRMDVKQQWLDGMIKPVGVDAEYQALARDLMARLKEGKVHHTTESADRHRRFMSVVQSRTEGFKPVVAKQGALTVGVVPQLGGRVVSLQRGNGANCLDPDAGGIEVAINSRALTGTDQTPYVVKKAQGPEILLAYRARHRYDLKRSLKVADGGLDVETVVTSIRTQEQPLRVALRVALDLGDVACVVARGQGGDWLELAVPADQTFTTRSLPPALLASGEVLFASAATGRGMRVRLPKGGVKRAMLLCDARANTARLIAMLPGQVLAGRASRTVSLRVTPVDAVAGLPKLTVAKEHRAERVVVEECLMGLGRLGTWGEFVADPLADDGHAVKLFGTHYEWCLQWRLDAGLFEPGAKYKVRMRIRVEKTEREGEAFWAGVYDTGRKRSWGQIAPRTSQVEDGYQWYDVATWTPEHSQYIWVGPGRFDKKGGKPSAIAAVYVDKFELTRVK